MDRCAGTEPCLPRGSVWRRPRQRSGFLSHRSGRYARADSPCAHGLRRSVGPRRFVLDPMLVPPLCRGRLPARRSALASAVPEDLQGPVRAEGVSRIAARWLENQLADGCYDVHRLRAAGLEERQEVVQAAFEPTPRSPPSRLPSRQSSPRDCRGCISRRQIRCATDLAGSNRSSSQGFRDTVADPPKVPSSEAEMA